jgi:two-component system, chemotaxis family, chemotaxis protein CheY
MASREVLVVEDDTDLRESLSQALRDHGFGVTPATNGQEALDLLHAGARPSVILLDLMMPGLNGWQLRAALRRDPGLAQIPQVVISAYMDEAEQAVLALPPDDCLRKPFHIRILIDALERHCQPQT